MRTFMAVVILALLRHFGVYVNAILLIIPILMLLSADIFTLGRMANKYKKGGK